MCRLCLYFARSAGNRRQKIDTSRSRILSDSDCYSSYPFDGRNRYMIYVGPFTKYKRACVDCNYKSRKVCMDNEA